MIIKHHAKPPAQEEETKESPTSRYGISAKESPRVSPRYYEEQTATRERFIEAQNSKARRCGSGPASSLCFSAISRLAATPRLEWRPRVGETAGEWVLVALHPDYRRSPAAALSTCRMARQLEVLVLMHSCLRGCLRSASCCRSCVAADMH